MFHRKFANATQASLCNLKVEVEEHDKLTE